MKRTLLCITTFIFMLASICFAGTWVQEGEYWKYDKGNNNFATNEWETIDGVEYHFDDLGHMATGLVQIGDNYHYFYDDGKMYEMGKTVNIMGTTCTIVTRGKIAKMPDDWSYDEMIEYEEEKKRQAAEKKELIRNQKAFEKAMANTPQFTDDQIALQNLKKAENDAANKASNKASTAVNNYPVMQLVDAEKRTAKHETEEGNKMTLTIAIPIFSGANSDKANAAALKMFSAVGNYLEESLGKTGGTYKFTTIQYVTNTDKYVTVHYKSETDKIEFNADIDFIDNTISID